MSDRDDGADRPGGELDEDQVAGRAHEIYPTTLGPVRWAELSAADAQRAIVELAAWVRWLAWRYGLDGREVPPCWWRHGALVEELAALWASWQGAFDPGQVASATAEWHRALDETRQRLRSWTSRSGCSAREHRDSEPPRWAGELYQLWWEEFIAAVEAHGTAGTDQPPSTPDDET